MSTRAGAWLGALVVALLATVPLLRELDAPYGRGMSGWQGAFFSIAAQRYEHNGLAAHAGYPSMQIAGAHISEDDLKRASNGVGIRESPSHCAAAGLAVGAHLCT